MQVCVASCRDYKLEASASEERKNEAVSLAVYLAVRTGVLVAIFLVCSFPSPSGTAGAPRKRRRLSPSRFTLQFLSRQSVPIPTVHVSPGFVLRSLRLTVPVLLAWPVYIRSKKSHTPAKLEVYPAGEKMICGAPGCLGSSDSVLDMGTRRLGGLWWCRAKRVGDHDGGFQPCRCPGLP